MVMLAERALESAVAVPPAYRVAEAFERFLGDAGGPFSLRQAVLLDEAEAYPQAACDALDRWGLPEHYIPVSCGGRLGSFEELLALVRAVSRRDLTVAVAHVKTLLGAISVWMAGTAEQKERLSRLIRAGRQVALGLTERQHGSDLLGNEVEAVPGPAGWALRGEKWLINNATRGAALTLFARTAEGSGPRSFSLFLVEKDALAPAAYTCLPKVRTHGIRGADISGIRFDGAVVSEDSVLGLPGAGLEVALRGFQVTRTVCAALSLGAGDTALRLALGFAQARRMYGEPLFAIPHVRRVLTDAFADLLICDCVTLAAARGLHLVPDQLSVWSSIVKYFVPVTLDRTVQELSAVLGARSYLRETEEWGGGFFQKLVRDSAIVSLFDGSSVVNLRAVGLQLRQLAAARARSAAAAADLRSRLGRLFRLREPLPSLDFVRLSLVNRGGDDVLSGLPVSLAMLPAGEREERVRARAGEVLAALAALDREVLAIQAGDPAGDDKSPELFELARRYCALYAAAACIQLWIHNRDDFDDWFSRGEWLLLCLGRILLGLGFPRDEEADRWAASAVERLLFLAREDRSFSIVPIRLAGAAERVDAKDERK